LTKKKKKSMANREKKGCEKSLTGLSESYVGRGGSKKEGGSRGEEEQREKKGSFHFQRGVQTCWGMRVRWGKHGGKKKCPFREKRGGPGRGKNSLERVSVRKAFKQLFWGQKWGKQFFTDQEKGEKGKGCRGGCFNEKADGGGGGCIIIINQVSFGGCGGESFESETECSLKKKEGPGGGVKKNVSSRD